MAKRISAPRVRGENTTDTEKLLWLRRQGVIIASQLPETVEDALRVLDHARTVVQAFIAIRPGA